MCTLCVNCLIICNSLCFQLADIICLLLCLYCSGVCTRGRRFRNFHYYYYYCYYCYYYYYIRLSACLFVRPSVCVSVSEIWTHLLRFSGKIRVYVWSRKCSVCVLPTPSVGHVISDLCLPRYRRKYWSGEGRRSRSSNRCGPVWRARWHVLSGPVCRHCPSYHRRLNQLCGSRRWTTSIEETGCWCSGILASDSESRVSFN